MTRSYGSPQRTDAQRLLDARLFIFGAAPHMLAGLTATQIADDKGVTQAKNREAVAKALLRRQMQENAALPPRASGCEA